MRFVAAAAAIDCTVGEQEWDWDCCNNCSWCSAHVSLDAQ